MGVWLLHDDEADRAIIFDSVSERALACDAFIGADAREQGEAFFGWLAWKTLANAIDNGHLYRGVYAPDPTDPRCYTRDGLDAVRAQFQDECLRESGLLNELGWALQCWFVEGARPDQTDELEAVVAGART